MEQAFTFRERDGWIGVGVDEDMQMVEGADQPDLAGEQKAVSKNITRHITDTHNGKGLRPGIDIEVPEEPLD